MGGAQKQWLPNTDAAQTLSVAPTALLQWFSSILLLLAVLLLRASVPAGARTHPHVEGSATQDKAPGGGRGRGAGWRGGEMKQVGERWSRLGRCQQQHSLCSLQGEDGEDGPSVHPPHARTVAHESQQDGADLRAQLKHTGPRFTLTECCSTSDEPLSINQASEANRFPMTILTEV